MGWLDGNADCCQCVCAEYMNYVVVLRMIGEQWEVVEWAM